MEISTGPIIWDLLVFVPINMAAAFMALILIFRVGRGKLNIPIVFIGLGFLFSALVPVIFGYDYLWAVPITQTFFGVLSLIFFMKVFGVFTLMSRQGKPAFFKKKEECVSSISEGKNFNS